MQRLICTRNWMQMHENEMKTMGKSYENKSIYIWSLSLTQPTIATTDDNFLSLIATHTLAFAMPFVFFSPIFCVCHFGTQDSQPASEPAKQLLLFGTNAAPESMKNSVAVRTKWLRIKCTIMRCTACNEQGFIITIIIISMWRARPTSLRFNERRDEMAKQRFC